MWVTWWTWKVERLFLFARSWNSIEGLKHTIIEALSKHSARAISSGHRRHLRAQPSPSPVTFSNSSHSSPIPDIVLSLAPPVSISVHSIFHLRLQLRRPHLRSSHFPLSAISDSARAPFCPFVQPRSHCLRPISKSWHSLNSGINWGLRSELVLAWNNGETWRI